MFGSTVLEVAIGLVFCYASVSVVASSLYEGVASVFKLRAYTLLAGVKDLLNDGEFTGLAKDLYQHALVNPRSDGSATDGKAPSVLPSYVDPKNFAMALIDTLQKTPGDFQALKAKIDEVPDAQIRALLQGMYMRAGGAAGKFQDDLERWFDDGMARVSGAYKRMSQLWTFVIGLVIVIALNIDTCRLFESLWNHPALVAQISAPNDQGAQDALANVKNLEALPIGWQKAPSSLLTIGGWLLTALSVLFGAPFWFDLLQRLVNLRGTGEKPGEKNEKK